MITPYHAKLYAHELSKRHSVADAEKLAGTLFDAQVDLNPHQVEAALFAFKSPLSKGAILADEVGLGKTIEAGLVLSQKWTEGRRRILIIGPANLRKQWAQELDEKFFLPTLILEAKNYNKMVKDGVRRPFEHGAIVICSFQFAARHDEDLMVTPWDLVVIDEAHRLRNVYRPDNKIGRALKTALANVPKILLTATPLQNSLMELYGLVSIIDDYAFGDAKSFRAQYTRLIGEPQFNELKGRLAPICQRTLRRQVLEYIRYTNRIPITQEFVPTEKEQVLYDIVSEYLRRPSLQALPSSQRTLMTLIMRKLLASSTFAIAGALDSLARKLECQLRDDKGLKEKLEQEISDDYEEFDEVADEWSEDPEEPELLNAEDIDAIKAEIEQLREFKDLAVSITENAKGESLLDALRVGFNKAEELGAQRKAIIFTESRRTQDYLVNLLSKHGYGDELVLFNGSNSDQRSKDIYNDWKEQHKNSDRVTGSRSADIRAALVDHFREQASIMIATEAAAEGINLQFCSMVVNYDLPWNPQRIEQRIGRCHRYGQKYDVVVVNFLNRKNAADQRVFELLAEKFQLFSGVFGASDEVLGAIESGVDFEKRIVSIYQTCRTTEEIETQFEQLRLDMDTQISETMDDTRQKLLENFDAEVHDRLKVNLTKSKEYLNRYESMLWAVTQHELGKKAKFDDEYLTFFLKDCPDGLEVPTGSYYLSKTGIDGHRYRLGHKLAQYVLSEASSRELNSTEIVFDYTAWPQKAVGIEPYVGKCGTMSVRKLSIRGADDQDHIIIAAITDQGKTLDQKTGMRLFELPAAVSGPAGIEILESISQTMEKRRKEILDDMAVRQSLWFDQEMDKLDYWAEDKRAGLKADLKDLDDQIKNLKRDARQIGNLPEKLKLQKTARSLEQKRDEAWRAYDDAAKDVEAQKDGLLDQVEQRLRQDVSEQELFTIRFEVR
jgi:ERCC4-related helicase